MPRSSTFALASLVLVAGCDALFGLREVSPSADARPIDAGPDAAPCMRY